MKSDGQDNRALWRRQTSELRSRLQAPIATREDALILLLAPLDLLGLTPDELEEAERIHANWCRLKLGAAPEKEVLQSWKWIEDIQEGILDTVLPDWSVALGEPLTHIILRQWFAPRGESTESHGLVFSGSLATMTNLLSKYSRSDASARGESQALLAEALKCFLATASAPAMAKACSINRMQSDIAHLKWQDICRQIVSLPTRAANAFGISISRDLEARNINRWILLQLEKLVWDDFDASITSALLQRITRTGILSTQQDWAAQPNGGWPDLLRAIGGRIDNNAFPLTYVQNWKTTVGSLSDEGQLAFYHNLLLVLDAECLIKRQMGVLTTATEGLRPGAEGTRFLSPQTWETSLLLAQTFDLFLVGEDKDSSAEQKAAVLASLLAQPKSSTFSPCLVRMLVHLLQIFDVEHENSLKLLGTMLKSWSTTSTTSTSEEEIFRATLIGLLIATAPANSKELQALSTSEDFIHGVQAHLEHLSPTVRRMAMLLAEIAAERVDRELKFPRKIWDGRGEGREEARVLRATILSFPQREHSLAFSQEKFLEVLNINPLDMSQLQIRQNNPVPRPRGLPKTRRLRQQVAAKEARSSKSLISDDTSALPVLTDISGSRRHRPLVTAISDEEASSSSSSDSESSDDEQLRAGVEDTEEGKAFGMGVPGSKNKSGPPIYMSQLGPLLRKNERDSIRMALRYGTELIERKAGWGGEVNEHATEVCMALCALQNNFRIAQFEERRLDMLTTLAYASPEQVAPCLIEQYFLYQYSMAQRISMLNALAFAATRLATGVRVGSNPETSSSGLDQKQKNVTLMANDISVSAIKRARKEGDARMPEIKRENSLLVKQARQVSDNASNPLVSDEKSKNKYVKVALSNFIFPFMSRMWKHIQNGSMASARYGRGIIDMPFMVGALLDTLSMLCYYAQSEPQFRANVVPDAIELVFAITRPHLAHIANHRDTIPDEKEEGGGKITVLGSASSLALVLLDACWQLDFAASLLRHNAYLLPQLQHWASALFEVAENGAGGDVSRLGRTSAALVLRINEINQHSMERHSKLVSR